MRSIIICEGSTDYALLQYYLRKAYGWNDSRENTLRDSTRFKMVRTLCKNHDTVSIGGALETFLLDAIAEKDEYDRRIIEKCRNFVDVIDPERRYLHKRRYMTKAKFDVYFSVRTAAEQFVERQNILRNVEWEKYNKIQSSFGKLEELSE